MEVINLLNEEFCKSACRGDLGYAMKCTCLENRSVIAHMMVFPELSGSSAIKAMYISFQGAVGLATGCRRPGGLPVCPVTYGTIGDIAFYVILHPQPPELVPHKVQCFDKTKKPSSLRSWLHCRIKALWIAGT